ncbi:MAG: UbiA family prenyltransferase [bacterium]
MSFENNIKAKRISFSALTRWAEVIDFNFIITLIGLMVVPVTLGLNFILAFFANFAALCFAFMFNDVEDANEDYQNEKKRKRNPVANGSISKGEGYMYCILVAVISLCLYGFLAFQSGNIWPLIAGISIIIVNILYSYRATRLKNIPILDLLSHGYMLAGGQFLVAFFAGFNISLGNQLPISFLIFPVLMIASMYGQLENEVRDYETDKKVGIKTLVSIIGIKPAQILQVVMLIITAVGAVFVTNRMNISFSWIIQSVLLIAILMIYPVIRNFIYKNKGMLKTDIHRVIMLGLIISLLLLNYGFVL